MFSLKISQTLTVITITNNYNIATPPIGEGTKLHSLVHVHIRNTSATSQRQQKILPARVSVRKNMDSLSD